MNPNFSVSNVYGDHMVFQRDRPIRIEGTAPAGATVEASFAGHRVSVVADASSNWVAEFPSLEAGGPHELTVGNTLGAVVTFRDILIGDVWLCSGQSNMEYLVSGDNRLYSLHDGKAVAAAAKDDRLRLFHTSRALGPDGPCDEAPGGGAWKVANTPEAVAPFSAVGYWFGVFLREMLGDVPVGMIHASWGGAQIEPWISLKAFEEAGCEYEATQAAAARSQSPGAEKSDRERYRLKLLGNFEAWMEAYFAADPATSAEALRDWAKPGLDLFAWSHGTLETLTEARTVGVSWFRREVEIPVSWAGRKIVIHFDHVTDCDETFFDGVKVGQTLHDTPCYWSAARDYPIPSAQATPGRHVVAVRMMNHFTQGGIGGQACLSVADGAETISIREGTWAARRELTPDLAKIGSRPMPPDLLPLLRSSMTTPSILYHAMIHPFTSLHVRGFVWYQGCSNTGNPEGYRIMQPLLIESWRQAFRSPDAAFLITQLSAFHQHTANDRLPDDFWKALKPMDSGFARLREVQDDMRTIPNTGVAVTIDIGDHSDVHPPNKKDVAYRLAKQAERLCYGGKDDVDGPRYAKMAVEGNRIRLSFTQAKGGLVVRGDVVGAHSFAIAGADGIFVWAEAQVEEETVVVWSPEVPKPMHVRYAWAMYPPNANLYNRAGFPMVPFRTDRVAKP